MRTRASVFNGCHWHNHAAASAPRATPVVGAAHVDEAQAATTERSATGSDALASFAGRVNPQPLSHPLSQLGSRDSRVRLEYEERDAGRRSAGHLDPANPSGRLIENLQPDAKSEPAGETIAGVKDHHGVVPIKRSKRDRSARLLPLFDALGDSALLFSAPAVRPCVYPVPMAYLISPPGHGGEDNEGAVKDKAGNASGSHYYSRAYPDQAMRGLARAPKRRCRGALHQRVIRAASGNNFEAAEFPCCSKGAERHYARRGSGALLCRANHHQPLGSSAKSQGLGPNSPESRKVSCLDGAKLEVHNFHAERGVKETEGGARKADQDDAAVGAALAEGERGRDKAVRPFEAGVHRGAELQMSQLVGYFWRKPKRRSVSRVRGKRALLLVGRRDMLAAALAQEAARSYLKSIEQRLDRVRPEGRWRLVWQCGGGGVSERGQAALPRVRSDTAQLDGARARCGAESVRAFQELQNSGAGRDAGPATTKELELY